MPDWITIVLGSCVCHLKNSFGVETGPFVSMVLVESWCVFIVHEVDERVAVEKNSVAYQCVILFTRVTNVTNIRESE